MTDIHPGGTLVSWRRREPDLICLSHLRWDWVFQRPQHLMTRFARDRRVWFVEEPLEGDGAPRLDIALRGDGLRVVVPRLPAGLSDEARCEAMARLLDRMVRDEGIRDYVLWYYTPMALPAARLLRPLLSVYDCMDELSAFAGAPPDLRAREAELFRQVDLVFTGGQSLYEAKRALHRRMHPFPSSIDGAHFRTARRITQPPDDQAGIPGPRLGFAGVIDERMDLDLVDALAARCPEWQVVMVGPVAKIDPRHLPSRPNLHWLGPRPYASLPAYLAGWSVGLLPFARNEATRYISPTKTPEYLAAGLRVVSTSVRDVVRPYGERGLVEIADQTDAFVDACRRAVEDLDRRAWLRRVDGFLAHTSWDRTWRRMSDLMTAAIASRRRPAVSAPSPLRSAGGLGAAAPE